MMVITSANDSGDGVLIGGPITQVPLMKSRMEKIHLMAPLQARRRSHQLWVPRHERGVADQCYNCRISTYPMPEEQLKAFFVKAKGDTSLQEKLKSAANANSVVEIAKEAGFIISADDLTKTQSMISDREQEGVERVTG